jgi:hypothetical protein
MFRRLTLFLLVLAAPAGAERRYSVTDFDRVQVEGPYEVRLRTGLPTAVVATGSEQALERVTVEVQGRTLRIHANRSAWGGYPGADAGPVRIEAATRDLAAATILGSGSLTVDRARALRLDLTLGGSSRLTVGALDVDNLILGLVGSGRIVLAGHARQMRATVQGSGDLDAQRLAADDLQLSAATAGTILVGSARSAKVVASGQGDVTVGGNPACTVEARGSGSVRCGPR